MLGRLGAVWGVAGVSLLLSYSTVRLSSIALDALRYELSWYHWLALVLNVIYMAYSEGYSGFQRGFSPRVVARAKYLFEHPNLLHTLLAPIFCMGYFSCSETSPNVHFRPHNNDSPVCHFFCHTWPSLGEELLTLGLLSA